MNSKEDYQVSQVYVWGSDEYGQLGLGNQNRSKVYTIPRFCSFNVQIKMISCGDQHAGMIANAGYVYTMGSNQQGRLGIGNRTIPFSIKPYIVQALTFHRVKHIDCGHGHNAAVTDMGELFTWGLGEHGALGVNTHDNLWSPMRVAFPDVPNAHILTASCGMKHTVINDDKGRLYTCGSNQHGQLGTGHKRSQLMPALITTINDKMNQVTAGTAHTMVLTKSGRVFAMGSNASGELGTGSKRDSHYPLQVKDLEPFNISKVAAGHHSAAVTDNGDLYVWGRGSFGEYARPTRVAGMRAAMKDVDIGSYSAAAIDYEGNVWTWGSSAKGQLGHGGYQNQDAPTLVEAILDKNIKMVSVGSSFIISLAKSDESSGQSPLRSKKVKGGDVLDNQEYGSNQKKTLPRQQRGRAGSPLRNSSNTGVRDSNTSVRFAPKLSQQMDASGAGSIIQGSPNRGRGGVGGPNADTPQRYRRGATKSPSGGAPRPIMYKQKQSPSTGRKIPRGRSKNLNESVNNRDESPAYKAAISRLNDVTQDRDNLQSSLIREKRERENTQGDLKSAMRVIEKLEHQSPNRDDMRMMANENDKLRDSIRNQERSVANLSDQIADRNRQIDFLRERLSAVERDNRDIAERVAIDHQRKQRESQREIDRLMMRIRELQEKCGISMEEAESISNKYERAQNVADNQRKNREEIELELRGLRALLEDEKTRNRALNDELAIARRNNDATAQDFGRDMDRLKSEFNERIDEKNIELDRLRRAVDDLKYDKDDLCNRVGSNTHQNEILRKEIITWKETVNKHVDENTELKKIIEDLEQKNRKLSESLDYYLYNRAADYKERTLQALQRNQELHKDRLRGSDIISPSRLDRSALPERVDTRSALNNINRMVDRDRQNAEMVRQSLRNIRNPQRSSERAPQSLTPHEGRSPAPDRKDNGIAQEPTFDGSYYPDKLRGYDIKDDPKYVKSNHQFIEELKEVDYTPKVPIHHQLADESAITSAGKRDPLTVSELGGGVIGHDDELRKSRHNNSSPLRHSPGRASRSPNRYDNYDQDQIRRERMERNRLIEQRHAHAHGSAQKLMDILEVSSPIRRKEGIQNLVQGAPGLNVSPIDVDETHLRVSPHKKSHGFRSSHGQDTTAASLMQGSYGQSPERADRVRELRDGGYRDSPIRRGYQNNNKSAAVITKGVVKGLKDDVTRKLDNLKRNKEAIDEILNKAPQI